MSIPITPPSVDWFEWVPRTALRSAGANGSRRLPPVSACGDEPTYKKTLTGESLVAVGALKRDDQRPEFRDGNARPQRHARRIVERPDRHEDPGRVLQPGLVVAAVLDMWKPSQGQLDPPPGSGLGQRGGTMCCGRQRRTRHHHREMQ